jgi:hypothetical protein
MSNPDKEQTMKAIRKRLNYANVMSSMAVFFVVGGGATALATTHLGRNSVGTAQLKPGAVTAAKIRDRAITGSKIQDGSITGTDIQVDSLPVPVFPPVPVADPVAGEVPFGFYVTGGETEIATVGPFRFDAFCNMTIDGDSRANAAGLLVETTFHDGQDNGSDDDATYEFSPTDGQEGEEFGPQPFGGPGGRTIMLVGEKQVPTGQPLTTSSKSGRVLVTAKTGATVIGENLTVGVQLPGHPDECFFAGTIKDLTSGS